MTVPAQDLPEDALPWGIDLPTDSEAGSEFVVELDADSNRSQESRMPHPLSDRFARSNPIVSNFNELKDDFDDFDEDDFDEDFDDDFEEELEDEYDIEQDFGEEDSERDRETELPGEDDIDGGLDDEGDGDEDEVEVEEDFVDDED